MGISIVRYLEKDQTRWGMLEGDQIVPVAESQAAYHSHRDVMRAYFNGHLNIESSERVALADRHLIAPVTPDIQVFCQGLNYASHREEGGVRQDKGENLIFSKPPSSICGPYDDIVRPRGCQLLDYEIELALVLKADVPAHTVVTPDNLAEYVGGITLTNDISARDFMFGAPMMQWFKGKGQRTFCPTGPVLYLLDPEEIDLLDNLHLTLSLNGEVRQDATTDLLIFKPGETLTELSSFADINPGDMLLTGTPGGVILNATPRVGLAILLNFTNDAKRRAKLIQTQKTVRYLEPGDQLELSICSRDGNVDLGIQKNRVIDAQSA